MEWGGEVAPNGTRGRGSRVCPGRAVDLLFFPDVCEARTPSGTCVHPRCRWEQGPRSGHGTVDRTRADRRGRRYRGTVRARTTRRSATNTRGVSAGGETVFFFCTSVDYSEVPTQPSSAWVGLESTYHPVRCVVPDVQFTRLVPFPVKGFLSTRSFVHSSTSCGGSLRLGSVWLYDGGGPTLRS